MQKLLVPAGLLFVCGAALADAYSYFPELAADARAGNAEALPKILAQADTILPGAKLEELAELSSLYVKPSPAVFLRAQSPRQGCFGASFLGPDYIDQPEARAQELAARRVAIQSVTESELASVKARCLAELHGS